MNKNKEITIEIKTPELILLLLVLSVILILELQVTFSTKIVFGDEGFHARLAQWIAEEQEYPVWNPIAGTKLELKGFERPPLYNILQASFLFLFGFNEALIKFLTPFIAFLTGIVVYLLVRRLYNKEIGFISSLISVTVPSFVTYAVLFYTDALFTFYLSLFFLLFILAIKEGSKKYWVLSGIFGGFAFLTKIFGLAVYIFAILVFLYELMTRKKFGPLVKRYLAFGLILLLVPAGFFLRNLYFYRTPLCALSFLGGECSINKFQPKYQFAGRVEQVGTEQSIFRMGIVNYLDFAYGSIWFVTFGFLAGLMLIFFKRNTVNDLVLLAFLSLIIAVGFKPTEITYRAEDTARYTLGWISMIALVVGNYFERLYNLLKKYQKYVALIVFVFIIALGYLNLRKKLDTMVQVKRFSPTFFEACDWIKQNTPEDAIIMTVWAHRAQYNCQRKTGGTPDIALSRNVSYTLEVAEQLGITHLFIQKFSIDPQNKHLSENYDLDFVQFLEDNPEQFKKVYENGPPLQQCLQQGGCDGNIVYEVVY